jgi:hypothetical protein
MTKKARDSFAAKHGQNAKAGIAAAVREGLEKAARAGTLSCAAAFKLSADLQKPPAEIGRAADLLGIRLVKCQLGLFGYAPEKKVVRPAAAVDPALEDAVRAALQDGRLACRLAWELAERFRMPKMKVSAACETLGIKVKPCQLGAF